MKAKARLVVFISGSGSNLQAIIDAIAAGQLAAEIVLVVSNRRAAYGLVRAEAAGIETLYWPLKRYKDAGLGRDVYEADLAARLRPLAPDLLVLAGWMHILGAAFLQQFPDQILNLHPALPGQFVGAHAIEEAYAAYRRGEIAASGCMVHTAVAELDAGPVITQETVPFYPNDSIETFAERLHAAEHRILIQAIAQRIGRVG